MSAHLMDRAQFTALAEQAHTDAEANMRTHGHVAQAVLLYGRNAEFTVCLVRGDFDHQIHELRKIVRSIGAVAAIRIASAFSLQVASGAHRLPYDDLPVPAESPDARLVIVSEARWPHGGIHQVRMTGVESDAVQGLMLTREEGDPEQSFTRNDVLAQLFPGRAEK
jgi:hypothetical protein